jgi:hypothetical protein
MSDKREKFYFFSRWSSIPGSGQPELMWTPAEDAESKHKDGAVGYVEDVVTENPSQFVAVQTVFDTVPTCICCPSFGKRHEHMAMLFHYDAQALRNVKPNGVLSATIPAPLDASDIEFVFCQLAKHPNYLGQRVVAISQDHEIIELVGEDITVIEPS